MDTYEDSAFSRMVSEFRHGVEDGMMRQEASGETEEPLSPAKADKSSTIDKDGTVSWRFKLGQCISHKDQILPSLVMGRVRTKKGHEVYGVRSFANVDPCRDRMILADCLVDVVPGSRPCQDCLLFQTGMCPGDRR